jgi:hypothetical protein
MCKRHIFAPDIRLAGEGAYEGQTMRLGPREPGPGMRRANSHGWGFHWWMLWLIWPLVALSKWITPLVLSTLATVTGSIGELGAQLVAVLLIIAGISLLRRS